MRGRRRLTLCCVLGASLALPGVAAAQIAVTGELVQQSAEHRVTGASGVEIAQGRLIGVAARVVLPVHHVEARLHAIGGQLDAANAAGESRDMGEVALTAAWAGTPWLAAEGALLMRGYATPLARQRWTVLRLGGVARAPLLDGRLRALGRLSVAPVASVSGLDAPRLPVEAGSGLELVTGRFEAAMIYALERYDFPRRGMSARREQLTALTVRAGWRFGGPRPAAP